MNLRFSTTLLFFAAIVLLFEGCNVTNHSESNPPSHQFDFSTAPNDWSALFSSYPVGSENDYQLTGNYRPLPPSIDSNQKAFFISGDNHSDDLNMFLKHRVTNLKPKTTYEVTFDVWFATNEPSGCPGVGGAPGEGVSVHTDASTTEPHKIKDSNSSIPYYRLSLAVDSLGYDTSWYKETEIGNIANSQTDCAGDLTYEIKHLSSKDPAMVTTDKDGNAWIIVGTRSGFEAVTSLYYTKVTADFVAQ